MTTFRGGPPPAEATSIFRNSLVLALGKAGVLLTFALFIFAARVLGDERFGHFTLGLTVAAVLFTLPNWGTNRYSAIVAARRPEDTESIVALNLGLTSVLAVLYLPLTFAGAHVISGEPAVVRTAMLIAVSLLVRNLGQLLRLMFRVHDVYLLDVRSSVVEKASIAGAGAAALLVSPTPASLAVGFILGRTGGTLAAVVPFVRRIAPIGLRFGASKLWSLFRSGTPIAARNVLSWANLRVDMLVLGAMAPAAQVGWYGAVYRLIEGTQMLPSVVLGSLGPTLSASYGAGREDVVNRLYRRGYRYLLIAALFLAALFAVHGHGILVLVFGEEYGAGTASLRILGFAVAFVFMRQLAIEVMDNVDIRRATAIVFAGVLALNTGLNLLLVPRLGHVGAALATLGAEASLAAALFAVLRRQGYSAAPLRAGWRPLLAAAGGGGLMLLLSERPVLGTAAGAGLYLLALTALGTWDGKDRALAREMLGRTRDRVATLWGAWRSGEG